MSFPRPRRFARTLTFGAALALTAAAAQAQSLQELYGAARGYDATYLSARALLDSAQSRRDQASASRWPTVGLAATTARQLSSTPDASSTRSANTTASNVALNGSQTLFNRVNDVTIAQAEKVLQGSQADFSAAEQDLILRVAQAYFNVLAAQDTLATARGNQAAINEQLESAKRNFEVGTATITDTREAQARFDLARANEIVAANDLLTKRIALDQLVGRTDVAPRALAVRLAVPPAMPLAVPPSLPPAVAPTDPASVDAWVLRSDAEHPQVINARLRLDQARLETEKARAGNLPTVALTASYGRGHSSTAGEALPSGVNRVVPYTTASASTGASLGLRLDLPLFTSYAVQNRIRETLALEDKFDNDLQAARRGVAQDTRTAFYAVSSGNARVAALEAAESSSKLALEATKLGYRVGVRVNLDVLNAEAQLFDTQAQLAKARYDLVIAGLRLRQASGRVTAEDVAVVNGLLVR